MPQTDITFKELFGRNAQPLLELLLPEGVGPLQVVELNPELPATLRRVGLLLRGVCQIRAQGPLIDRLLALDWQVQADPELPATMFLRASLAFYKYRVRATTLLLFATPAAATIDPRVVWGEHERAELEHDVLVFKLYEIDAERALSREHPELWVLAAAMDPAGGDRAALLSRVQERLASTPELSAEARERLLDFATTFATLDMTKDAAQAFLQVARRRSQTMLDLRQSGYAQLLISEGKAEGKVEGKAEGKAEAVLAVMDARLAALSDGARRKILTCGDLELLNQWLLLAISGRDAELATQVDALVSRAA